MSLCQLYNASRSASRAMYSFFKTEGNQTAREPEGMARILRSSASSKVIKAATTVATYSSDILCGAILLYLMCFWNQHQECDQPLLWWLAGHCILRTSITSLRCKCKRDARALESAGEGLEESMAILVATPAWRLSKFLTMVNGCWISLGTYRTLRSSACNRCVYTAALTVLVNSLVHALVIIGCFKGAASIQPEEPRTKRPATPEQIHCLPCSRFSALHTSARPSAADKDEASASKHGAHDSTCMSCAVCLSDYREMELLRHLPCGHQFHMKCVDDWLVHSKQCPLCMRSIDLQ